MSRFSSLVLCAALISGSTAFKWVSIPTEFKVGVPVTISWDMEGGVPERITLQHEEVGGLATDQYETLIEWVTSDPTANSLQWTPNVAGPSFQLEMVGSSSVFTHDWGTAKFEILAADGSYVSTVPSGIEHWSNLLPQSVHSGVWPVSMASAVGHSTVSASTTSEAASATPSATTATSTTESVAYSETVASPSVTSVAVVPTTAVVSSVQVTTFVASSSLAVVYPAGNTTIAVNGTSVGFPQPTSTPAYFTGAAPALHASGASGLLLGALWVFL